MIDDSPSPSGEWLLPAVSRRYVRRAVRVMAQSARNDEETDALLRVGLLKSYVRQGRTVLGIKPPHYLREKEQGCTDRKGRFVSLSVCQSVSSLAFGPSDMDFLPFCQKGVI